MSDPRRRRCPDCQQTYWNAGAHAEACPGPMVFTGKYQCDKCLGASFTRGGRCFCGGIRWPLYRAAVPDLAATKEKGSSDSE